MVSYTKNINSIKIIQKLIREWNTKLKNLNEIKYNNSLIRYIDINSFSGSTKSKNDSYNKIRENIIGAIINNKIDSNYYKLSRRWRNLKYQLDLYIKKLCEIKNIYEINNIERIHKSGRHFNYDFLININNSNESYLIEFRFNASNVNETPQFVSPVKPSKYLDFNFEEWHYDNYLPLISSYSGFKLPDREIYFKTIHSNKVKCMEKYKEKYDNNIDFNKYCKKIDKKSIKEFIIKYNLKIDELSDYLIKSQDKKEYMCYKNGKFYYDKINTDIYQIIKVIKRENTNYIVLTKSGMKLEIKLRFKNGCGLQFPAFQIKRKIPTIQELKSICKDNNITVPRLKKNICQILDKHNIIY